MSPSYVLATTRPWNEELAPLLEGATGCEFFLVRSPRELDVERLSNWQPRYVFFPHWSYRIPRGVYEQFECVMFHMTDLPFGRGGSPLQNLIARGIYETVVTAFKCVEDLDAGPVYLKRPLVLHGAAEEIFLRARDLVAGMIEEIVRCEPVPTAQRGETTTFSRRRPEDGDLAQVKDLGTLFDFVRMLDADGYPKAFMNIGAFRLEFTRAARKQDSVVADVRIVEREHA